jgi:hypothetical protein
MIKLMSCPTVNFEHMIKTIAEIILSIEGFKRAHNVEGLAAVWVFEILQPNLLPVVE